MRKVFGAGILVVLLVALGVTSWQLARTSKDLAYTKAVLAEVVEEGRSALTRAEKADKEAFRLRVENDNLRAELVKLKGARQADYYEIRSLASALAVFVDPDTTIRVEEKYRGATQIYKQEGMLVVDIARPWPSGVRPEGGTFDRWGNNISPSYGWSWNIPALGQVTVSQR